MTKPTMPPVLSASAAANIVRTLDRADRAMRFWRAAAIIAGAGWGAALGALAVVVFNR